MKPGRPLALLAALTVAAPARADALPPSLEAQAEQERIRRQSAREQESCNIERQQGPDDACFTCWFGGDLKAQQSCEGALARYGFERACGVHSANTRPLRLNYTLMCRAEGDAAAPLPCDSLGAIEGLTSELQDHSGACTRHSQQGPEEQCVRCGAADCQELSSAGFSERCESYSANGSRRASLWCRPRSEERGLQCSTLARLNYDPEDYGERFRAPVEERSSVSAAYVPPPEPPVIPTQRRLRALGAAAPDSGGLCATRQGAPSAGWGLLLALGLCVRRRIGGSRTAPDAAAQRAMLSSHQGGHPGSIAAR